MDVFNLGPFRTQFHDMAREGLAFQKELGELAAAQHTALEKQASAAIEGSRAMMEAQLSFSRAMGRLVVDQLAPKAAPKAA